MKRVAAALVLGASVSACTTLLGLTPVPDVNEGENSSAATMTYGQDDGAAADSSGDSGSSTLDAGGDGTLDVGPVNVGDGAVNLGDGGNLIPNPSCEDGISPWTTLGGTPLASSTTYVHTGDTASCWSYDRHDEENIGEPASYDGPMQHIGSLVVPGLLYNASVWVLWSPPLDAGPNGNYELQTVKLTVKLVCGQAVGYPYSQWAVNTPAQTWVHVVMQPDISVPQGCDPLDVELYVEGPDLGLDLYVDEMTLTLVN
jgi:hypothetical protein